MSTKSGDLVKPALFSDFIRAGNEAECEIDFYKVAGRKDIPYWTTHPYRQAVLATFLSIIIFNIISEYPNHSISINNFGAYLIWVLLIYSIGSIYSLWNLLIILIVILLGRLYQRGLGKSIVSRAKLEESFYNIMRIAGVLSVMIPTRYVTVGEPEDHQRELRSNSSPELSNRNSKTVNFLRQSWLPIFSLLIAIFVAQFPGSKISPQYGRDSVFFPEGDERIKSVVGNTHIPASDSTQVVITPSKIEDQYKSAHPELVPYWNELRVYIFKDIADVESKMSPDVRDDRRFWVERFHKSAEKILSQFTIIGLRSVETRNKSISEFSDVEVIRPNSEKDRVKSK